MFFVNTAVNIIAWGGSVVKKGRIALRMQAIKKAPCGTSEDKEEKIKVTLDCVFLHKLSQGSLLILDI